MKNKKVLIISTVGLGYEGITNVIVSNLRAMNKKGLDIYVASSKNSEPDIESILKKINCKIINFPDRNKHTFSYFFKLTKFIRKQKIDVVHANGNSATLAIEMLAAKIGGCPKRIAHSHNTTCDHVKMDKMLRPLFYRTYTDAVACGIEAGNWLFPNRSFLVIPNGRNLSKFKFNKEKRKEVRKDLNLGNEIVIGHVGGFVSQKNHSFLLKIYSQLLEKNIPIKFFMIGDGEEREKIEQQSKELGFGNQLVFTGNVNNVEDYLQAMDVMIFPSLFEGLPLSVLEWQISGLPVVMSNNITDECILNDSVKRLPLSDGSRVWAQKTLDMVKQYRNKRELISKKSIHEAVIKKFDINVSSQMLRNEYMK